MIDEIGLQGEYSEKQIAVRFGRPRGRRIGHGTYPGASNVRGWRIDEQIDDCHASLSLPVDHGKSEQNCRETGNGKWHSEALCGRRCGTLTISTGVWRCSQVFRN